MSNGLERDRQILLEGQRKGRSGSLRAMVRLSGPGWLQSAITLGGGSLSGSLYLGVLAGVGLLWLQPLAMLLGVVMLAAIAHVTLTSGERPFDAIRRHVNPALAWGWAIATLLANLVWSLPQFALGTAALRQNLLPGVLGPDAVPDNVGKGIVVGALLLVAGTLVWTERAGTNRTLWFDRVLKVMVGGIVLSFLGVVGTLAVRGDLPWGAIARGFIPDPALLWQPAAGFEDVLNRAGEWAGHWRERIVSQQRDVLVTAAATAVGINMTFLLPYSLLRRGWDRDFRGLATFDLCTGLFVPFTLATSCVVIASATQFHTRADDALVGFHGDAPASLLGGYEAQLDGRLRAEWGDGWADFDATQKEAHRAELPLAERQLAAMLVKRDAFDLARALEPLTGHGVSHWIFGLGVLGMALSTILMLMLINGFVVREMLGAAEHGAAAKWGALAAGLTGALGPFLWSGKTQFWLAVPTSVFGMVLLPIAYTTFLFLMNSRSLLGSERPSGGRRVLWNTAMGIALVFSTLGAGWSLWTRTQLVPGTSIPVRWPALALVAIYIAIVIACRRKSAPEHATRS